MLVFTLDLEDVKEVGGGGLDLDQILVRALDWVWKSGDTQVVDFLQQLSAAFFRRPLEVSEALCRGREVLLTLTYWATCIPFMLNY